MGLPDHGLRKEGRVVQQSPATPHETAIQGIYEHGGLQAGFEVAD